MIEIIYNKEKETAVGNEAFFSVPRNIRQIGNVPKENKIYIEDYVHTYVTSDWKEDANGNGSISILLGKYNWKDGVSYVFIKSAMRVEHIRVNRETIPFSDEVWGTIYEEMKQYFPGQEVVGWFLSLPNGAVRLNDKIRQIHLAHFGGNDKVLLLADPCERECAFFSYRNNRLEKQKGYYIFYEKNECMQEYMLAKNPEAQKDFAGGAQDRAVQDFRKIIERKMEEKTKKEWNISWGHVACAGIVLALLMTSVFWVQNKGLRNDLNQEEEVVSEPDISVGNMNTEPEAENHLDVRDPADGLTLLTPEDTGNQQEHTASSDQGENILNDAASINVPDELSGNSDAVTQSSEAASQEMTEAAEEPAEETSISVYTKYTVRQGDTISKICMRYYGDFSKITEICKINNLLEEDVIYPGQTILLP